MDRGAWRTTCMGSQNHTQLSNSHFLSHKTLHDVLPPWLSSLMPGFEIWKLVLRPDRAYPRVASASLPCPFPLLSST